MGPCDARSRCRDADAEVVVVVFAAAAAHPERRDRRRSQAGLEWKRARGRCESSGGGDYEVVVERLEKRCLLLD